MLRCLRLMRDSGRQPRRLLEGTLVAEWPSGDLSHGRPVRLLALSPSSRQFDNFLAMMGKELRKLPGVAKGKLVAGRNDLSIATLLEMGDGSVLLGADLENSEDPYMGWPAVIQARKDPSPQATTIKIPHHGSKDAHNNDVWTELLVENPVSVVTPWRLAGRSLPTANDMARIRSKSSATYISADAVLEPKKRYASGVVRQIQSLSVTVSGAICRCGHVQLRFPGGDLNAPVANLFNGAKQC